VGRVAGIDYGTVRIGVALSDERRIIAQPLTKFSAHKTKEETAKALAELLLKHAPLDAVVIGLPLMMNGKESPMSQEVRAFAKILETLLSCPIIFWDERLSSAQIERTLKEGDVKRKQRAGLVDTLAATLILQNYLDTRF
jgi:putative Holliday junction resolvase